MAELGSTTDPHALIPGSVSALADAVWRLRSFADALVSAGDALARIDTEVGWRGSAADRFRDRYDVHPRRWREAGDSFTAAAAALDRYTSTLAWAQARAVESIELYAHGEQESIRALAARDAVAAGARTSRVAIMPVFQDPGEATREAARELLEHVRAQLRESGDRELRIVVGSSDGAPELPTWWETAGSAVGDACVSVLHAAEDVGVAAVNGVASFGNAMIQHPGDAAAMVAGLALMSLSANAEAGGLLLDATGVGAVAGVPINAVAAAGIVAGAALATSAAVSLGMHANSDSRVSPLEARAEEPRPGSHGRPGTKTDRCREHLTERDLDAARRELNGDVVATKSDGTPWNHVGEVRDAQRGLVNRIEQLKRMLADSRISEQTRSNAQSELSEASRLLDYSRQFVPTSS